MANKKPKSMSISERQNLILSIVSNKYNGIFPSASELANDLELQEKRLNIKINYSIPTINRDIAQLSNQISSSYYERTLKELTIGEPITYDDYYSTPLILVANHTKIPMIAELLNKRFQGIITVSATSNTLIIHVIKPNNAVKDRPSFDNLKNIDTDPNHIAKNLKVFKDIVTQLIELENRREEEQSYVSAIFNEVLNVLNDNYDEEE